MKDFTKRAPEPLDGADAVAVALARAASGEMADDLTIDFRVAGGMARQQYRLSLKTTGRRLEACSLQCDLSKRRVSSDHEEIDSDVLSSLAQRLLASEVLGVTAKPPRFLPDTLVGIITIAVGEIERRYYFAADPDQASVQDLATPRAVALAADALYDAAGRVLHVESVRP